MPGWKAGEYRPDDRALDEAIAAERTARAAEMDAAWNYANGVHKRPIKGPRVILNLCGAKVDRLVAALDEPVLELPGGVEAEPDAADERVLVVERTPEQEALETWLRDVNFKGLTHDAVITGLVTGHVFLKVYTRRDGAVRLALLDPRLVTVVWNEADVTDVLFYRVEWQRGRDTFVQDVVRATDESGAGDGWRIIEYKRGRMGLEVLASEDWPYSFAPIADWKNAHNPFSYYGRSDAGETARNLNDGVNYVASNTAKIIQQHASPKTVITGGKLDMTQQSAPDLAIVFESKDAKVYNLEMQGDLASSMTYLETLRAAFFSEGRVVDVTTVRDKIGQLTNFGVRMLFADMIALVNERRAQYGPGLAEAARRALVVAGVDAPDAPVATFPEFLPANRLEQVQALKTEIEIGTASRQTAAAELGRDYAVETERMAEEAQDKAAALTNTLTALGTGGLF